MELSEKKQARWQGKRIKIFVFSTALIDPSSSSAAGNNLGKPLFFTVYCSFIRAGLALSGERDKPLKRFRDRVASKSPV